MLWQPGRVRFAPFMIGIIIGFALALAACGGSGDGAGGGDVDFDPPGGDGEFLVGGDLDIPDWLPPGITFPDGSALKSATYDPDFAMMSAYAVVEGGDIDATHQAMVAALAESGYELLSDEDNFAAFIRDGVGRVRVRTSEELGGTDPGITVDIDLWTDDQIEELRMLSAEEVVTPGSATAEVAGETYSADGECRIQGRSYQFLASDFTITLQIDTSPDFGTVYADVTTDAGGYSVEVGSEPDVGDVDASGFEASGQMTPFGDEEPGAVDFSIEVTCTG